MLKNYYSVNNLVNQKCAEYIKKSIENPEKFVKSEKFKKNKISVKIEKSMELKFCNLYI